MFRQIVHNKVFYAAFAIVAIGIIVLSGVAKDIIGTSGPQATAVVLVNQPPSAHEVANDLDCGKFKDLGSGLNVGVVDSGSCYKDDHKYAIDTFASSDSRNTWLQAAEPLGVDPKWETATSVTYPSVNS